MADKEEKKKKKEALKAEKLAKKEAKKAEKAAKKEQKGGEETKDEEKSTSEIGVLAWVIMGVIIVVLAGSGFVLGRLFAAPGSSEASESTQEDSTAQDQELELEDSSKASKDTWFYDLEPVVASLDEPSLTRYVRATLTLEINSALIQKDGEKLIEKKKPVLTDWLAIYLASLTLEDARGSKNQKRIQAEILDNFNEVLFPDARGQIKRILFQEFAIN